MTIPPMPPPPPLKPRRMTLSPDLSRLDLMGEIFINSPLTESLTVSARRLVDAITKDGVFNTLSAASVWYTYRHHPELKS